VNEWRTVLVRWHAALRARRSCCPRPLTRRCGTIWAGLHATANSSASPPSRASARPIRSSSASAALLDEVERLADTDLSKLDGPARATRRTRLAEIGAGGDLVAHAPHRRSLAHGSRGG